MKMIKNITNKIIYNDFIEYLKKYINIKFVDKFTVWCPRKSMFNINEIFIGTDLNNKYYFLTDSLHMTKNSINSYVGCAMNNKEFKAYELFIAGGKFPLKSQALDNLFHLYYSKDLEINDVYRLIKNDVTYNEILH